MQQQTGMPEFSNTLKPPRIAFKDYYLLPKMSSAGVRHFLVDYPFSWAVLFQRDRGFRILEASNLDWIGVEIPIEALPLNSISLHYREQSAWIVLDQDLIQSAEVGLSHFVPEAETEPECDPAIPPQ